MNALRSKLRRLARLFIHFRNIASNAGREIKGCDEIFRTEIQNSPACLNLKTLGTAYIYSPCITLFRQFVSMYS